MHTLKNILGASVLLIALFVLGTFAYLFSFYNLPKTLEPVDCIVVFGAAVWPGGKPSDALSDRMYEAVALYERGVSSCLLFSGADSVYGRHEVDVMLDIAYELNVDYADVELDYEGVNTKATINNLDTNRSYALVSSDFHLARIALLAKQRGLDEYHVVGSTYRLGRYSSEPFLITREIGALWYYAFSK